MPPTPPPLLLNHLLHALSSISCWALGAVGQSHQHWSERRGGPGVVETPLSQCMELETKQQDPTSRQPWPPWQGSKHVSWGLQWLPLFFLPYHCVTASLYFSNGHMNWKMLFLWLLKRGKTSLIVTGCATSVRKARGLLRAQGNAALLSRTLSDNGPLSRSKLIAVHQHTTSRFKGNKLSEVFWLGSEIQKLIFEVVKHWSLLPKKWERGEK